MNLIGSYTFQGISLKDPKITLLSVRYIYSSMTAIIEIQMKSEAYDYIRNLSQVPFQNAFTNEDIESLILQAFASELNAPPESNGYFIVIPDQMQWVFPITISGYTCPLIEVNSKKCVEASYLQWKSFLDEFDKEIYLDYKQRLMPIFEYAKTNPEIITAQ